MSISFNRLDLNLLRVFAVVMEERSVLRAGQRLCLSQSAVSHSLARLREMLDDDLFVRTQAGMQPTVRALTMAPLIHEAWKSLEAAIGLPKFEPKSSTRRFTIAVSDFVTLVLAPQLLDLLKREAPLVELVILPDNRVDLIEQIDLGQIDAAIGTFADVPARFRSSALFGYDDVLVAGSSRPLGCLSLERLAGLSIAAISMDGDQAGLADGFIYERGLARRSEMYDRTALEQAFSGLQQRPSVAISLPHALALPALLEQTDLTAIIPRPVATSLARMHPLSVYELPYKTKQVKVSVLWHERYTDDAPQSWLREMLLLATEPLRARLIEFGNSARPPSATCLARVAVGGEGAAVHPISVAPKRPRNVYSDQSNRGGASRVDTLNARNARCSSGD
jgi:DNA-binding transcriptional LysR family regulator